MVPFPLSRTFLNSSISRWLHVLLALFLGGLFGMVALTISGIRDQEIAHKADQASQQKPGKGSP
ncbi:MAG: hypothetical protein ABI618_13025 [Nitrospirota bacterium]